MTYQFINHGVWKPYTPDPMPEWAVEMAQFGGAAIFLKNEAGLDFYEFRNTPDRFPADAIVATTLWYPSTESEVVKSVFRDHTMVFPFNQRLLEIHGVDPLATSVHNLFTEKGYDPVANAIVERPPAPVYGVSAAQAKTALFNAGILDKVELIVGKYQYRPVKIFYDSANNWLKSDPYVRAIAMELGLITIDKDGNEVDSGLDDLFRTASKL